VPMPCCELGNYTETNAALYITPVHNTFISALSLGFRP